jgi:glutamate/tyrosine decarboxylase-like PLP-dependent enzyme
MNSDQFRKAGYDMIEYAAQYMETLSKRDPLPHVTPGWLKKVVPSEPPQKGEPWENLMKDFEKVVMEGMAHWNHRQFFSYFPAGNCWASIMGDIFSNAVGVNGTSWESCPVVTELEIIVMDWACKFLGLPSFFLSHFSNPNSEGGGSIQTSASDAIMYSMIFAREDCVYSLRKKFPGKPRAVLLETMVAYCSSQCHSSVEKAGMIGTMRLRQLPADEQGGVRGETLRQAIITDMENGLVPYFYCAILGSTGICAFDDLMEVGPVCEEYGMWMHVDAAYAGSSFVCPEMRYLQQGYQYAWSTNTNTNKWMLTNFDASLHWVRYRKKMIDAFTGYDGEVWKTPIFPIINMRYYGLPSTRRFRGFKLWCVMRNYGTSGLQKYIRNHVSKDHVC